MSFLDTFSAGLMRAVVPVPTRLAAPPAAAQFEVSIPPEMQQFMSQEGAIATRVSRAMALQVPAVLRARNLIAGTLSTLPIHIHDSERRFASPTTLLEQIDRDVPNVVTLAQTYEDLLFEGVSWWRVTQFGWHGYPTFATHVPVSSVFVAPTGGLPSTARVTADHPFPASGTVYIDGRPVADAEVIRFDSPNPPLLTHAARAIRTCLALDRTASRYADEPVPLGVFSPRDDSVDMDDQDIQDLLDKWEEARHRRAWGYMDAGLDLHPVQFNADEIQLAEQRQHAVLEIARATGVDPEDLGVSTTTRTYQNAEQRRLDLTDFTFKAYIAAVEQRLSMRDVLPRGYTAKVNLDAFLRSDTVTRMNAYKVGKEVGAYTTDEIRALEDRPALTPAEKSALEPAPQAPSEEPARV